MRKTVARVVTIAPLAAGDVVVVGPGDMTVDATTPAGRQIDFTVTASGGWVDDVVPDGGDGGGICMSGTSPIPFPPGDGEWERDDLQLLALGQVPTLIGSGVLPIGTNHVLCFMTGFAVQGEPEQWATHQFTVTVVDPGVTVNVPADLTVEATSAAGASVTFDASAEDVFDGAMGIDCMLPSDARVASGDIFPIGTSTVTCYSDLNSRSKTGSASFDVIVQDTTAPTLTITGPTWNPVTGDYEVSLFATSADGAAVDYLATATDQVDPAPLILCGRSPGEVASIGRSSFTCHARDAAGNESQQVWIAVRVRAPNPVLTVPERASGEATSPEGGPVQFAATAVDFVGEPLEVTCNDASGAQPWPVVESGDVFRWGATLVNCWTKDRWDGDVSENFMVFVEDTTGPVITVPDDMRVVATSRKGAVVEFEATAHDARLGARPVTCSPASGSTFALGATTVTCTSSEPEILNRAVAPTLRAPGLVTSASFTVTVVKAAQEPDEPEQDEPEGDKGSKDAGDTEDATPVAGLGNTGASMTMAPGLIGLLLMFGGVVLLRRRRV